MNINVFKKALFSPYEPENVNYKVFAAFNICFIFLALLIMKIFSIKAETAGENPRSLWWSFWMLLPCVGVILALLFSRENIGRFLLLNLYAYNRKLLLLTSLNIVVFPVELLVLSLSGFSINNVTEIGTTIIKIITHAYLYYIVLRVFKIFIIDRIKKHD